MSKLKKDIGMAKKCDHSNTVALLEPSTDDVRCVSIVCCDCDFKIKTSNVYRPIISNVVIGDRKEDWSGNWTYLDCLTGRHKNSY